MSNLDHIEKEYLSYREGLYGAIKDRTEGNWLVNYFKVNKSALCFEGCHSLIVSEGDSNYYTLEINGDDYGRLSFIIQDDWQNDINRYDIANYLDEEEVVENFHKAFHQLKVYVDSLE